MYLCKIYFMLNIFTDYGDECHDQICVRDLLSRKLNWLNFGLWNKLLKWVTRKDSQWISLNTIVSSHCNFQHMTNILLRMISVASWDIMSLNTLRFHTSVRGHTPSAQSLLYNKIDVLNPSYVVNLISRICRFNISFAMTCDHTNL